MLKSEIQITKISYYLKYNKYSIISLFFVNIHCLQLLNKYQVRCGHQNWGGLQGGLLRVQHTIENQMHLDYSILSHSKQLLYLLEESEYENILKPEESLWIISLSDKVLKLNTQIQMWGISTTQSSHFWWADWGIQNEQQNTLEYTLTELCNFWLKRQYPKSHLRSLKN